MDEKLWNDIDRLSNFDQVRSNTPQVKYNFFETFVRINETAKTGAYAYMRKVVYAEPLNSNPIMNCGDVNTGRHEHLYLL